MKCKHGIPVGKFCGQCPRVATVGDPKPVYVYSRDAVIALNPIRKAQGLSPLTGFETYEIKNGKPTGVILGKNGKPL